MDSRSNRRGGDTLAPVTTVRRPSTRSSDDNHASRRYNDERRPRRSYPSDSDDSSQPRQRDRSRDDRNNRRSDRRDDRYRRDNSTAVERARRDRSRSRERSPPRRRSRSPPRRRHRRSPDRFRSPPNRSHKSLPSQDESFRRDTGATGPKDDAPEKQKPNFKPTGLLAKEANMVAGTTTVLKYHEPPEARKPPAKEKWRMYVFKKKDLQDTIHLNQKSCWLVGRDRKVTDLLLEHPSISKQHAVVQFRYLTTTNEYGDKTGRVKPYLIDLESANGTSLNGKKVETSRFIELVDADVLSFGDSEREYVMMLPSIDQ